MGMSTKWALLEIGDARKQRGTQGLRRHETEEYVKALEERNQALEKENEELKARLKQQHQIRFKANKKPSVPPSSSARKHGAPVGHPGWYRATPERIDRAVPVDAPTICPHCHQEGLEPTGEAQRQIQEDIVLQS